jgi:hypothetical protein
MSFYGVWISEYLDEAEHKGQDQNIDVGFKTKFK